MSKLFGPIRQTAYVVPDIEDAMRFWTEVLHVGPFFYLKSHDAKGATFRGVPTDMRISLAFANSGNMQIELVQQLNHSPSLFKEFLDAGRQGVQHIAFWTLKFDEDMRKYQDAGYEVVQTAGLSGPNNRNAFLERKGQNGAGIAIEISEIKGTKGDFFKLIADSAAHWDGTDPIRVAAR